MAGFNAPCDKARAFAIADNRTGELAEWDIDELTASPSLRKNRFNAHRDSVLATVTATVAGRTITQAAVGWIPGVGNAINAITAASVIEAVGWAADSYFRNLTP